VQEGVRLLGLGEPAAHEDLGERVAHAELVGQPPGGAVVDRRNAPGTVVDQGCITALSVSPCGDG